MWNARLVQCHDPFVPNVNRFHGSWYLSQYNLLIMDCSTLSSWVAIVDMLIDWLSKIIVQVFSLWSRHFSVILTNVWVVKPWLCFSKNYLTTELLPACYFTIDNLALYLNSCMSMVSFANLWHIFTAHLIGLVCFSFFRANK